jgi:hypothetical protein
MGGRVDAKRQATGNGKTLTGKVMGKCTRILFTTTSRVPATYNGYLLVLKSRYLAMYKKCRGWLVSFPE